MKTLLFVVLLTLSNLSFAFEKGCTKIYNLDPVKKPEHANPGGTADYSTVRDEFVYFSCRKDCAELRPNVDYITGLKSCEINGVPIEESQYKDIFLKVRHKICYVQVEGKFAYNLYIATDAKECELLMKDFFWCKEGSQCTYTYGVE